MEWVPCLLVGLLRAGMGPVSVGIGALRAELILKAQTQRCGLSAPQILAAHRNQN